MSTTSLIVPSTSPLTPSVVAPTTRNVLRSMGHDVSAARDAAEMLKIAKLDWEVLSLPLTSTVPSGAHDGMVLPTDEWGHYKIGKDKNGNPKSDFFGSVKSRYQLVQNNEAAQFMEKLHQDGILRFSQAGQFGNGRRIFISAELPAGLKGETKVGDSEITRYILLYNSHDSSSGLEVFPTTMRISCENSLRTARRGAAEKIQFRHCKSIAERMAQAIEMMDCANQSFDIWMGMARSLTTRKMTENEIGEMLAKVYPHDKAANKLAKERSLTRVEKFWAIYRNEPTQANIKGTAWGALNALTYLEDHGESILKGDRAESRFMRSMEGNGNDAKVAAWTFLTADLEAQLQTV